MKVKELEERGMSAFVEEQERLVIDQLKRLLQDIKCAEKILKRVRDAYAGYLETDIIAVDLKVVAEKDIHLAFKGI